MITKKKIVKPNNFGTSSSIKLLSRQEALEAIRRDFNPYDWDYIDYLINKQEIQPEATTSEIEGTVQPNVSIKQSPIIQGRSNC